MDYGVFWAAIRVLASEGPALLYDFGANARAIEPLRHFYGDPSALPSVGLALYPPIILFWYWPFTLLRPDIGYACWAAVNLAVAAALIGAASIRLVQSWLTRLAIAVAALASFPLGYSIFMGQPTVLWMLALYGAVHCARVGRDWRAGLFLGVLFLKPPLLAPILFVILAKRRWRFAAGVLSTGIAIGLSTILMVGLDGSLGYLRSLVGVSSFQSTSSGGPALVGVTHMISWRGLLASVIPPGAPAVLGLGATAFLTLGSFALLPIIWRGPWEPRSASFPLRILATLIVTLLAGYHVGSYSAALLIVPAIEAIHAPSASPTLRLSVLWALFASSLTFHLTWEPQVVAVLIASAMVGALAVALKGAHHHLPRVQPRVISATSALPI